MQLRKLLSCLLIGVVLVSIPHAIVHGQSTGNSSISGTVRCGGGCDTIGLAYGDPINVAGRIVAAMTMVLDPYTGAQRPDLPLQNAQTSFDVSAHGRYELQGVEPGIYDLYFQANGYPTALFAFGIAVHAGQNLSIDAYVAPQGYTASAPSTSTTQVSLTPYTSFTSTPSAITSTPSLQMPQPPQPATIQSTNNTQQLVSALAVMAAIVIGAAFLYSRQKERPKVTKAKKGQTKAKKATSSKGFCIECGGELPPKSKFCNNCGTKQS